MSYIKEYAKKLVTAEEAVKVVNSNDWVDYGWTTGTPVALDAALAARADELENVKGFLRWEMASPLMAYGSEVPMS